MTITEVLAPARPGAIGSPRPGAIDPDTDWKTVQLDQKRIDQAMRLGYARSAENHDTLDKSGYNKNEKRAHSNKDNDALGVAFEIACTLALGLDPDDKQVITLFQKKQWLGNRWGYPPDRPDILGVYECRRLNDRHNGITYYDKDIANTAYVLAGVVHHECYPDEQRIKMTGKVTILGWNYPLIDYQYVRRQYRDGGTIKNSRMRPLHQLPLIGGTSWQV